MPCNNFFNSIDFRGISTNLPGRIPREWANLEMVPGKDSRLKKADTPALFGRNTREEIKDLEKAQDAVKPVNWAFLF